MRYLGMKWLCLNRSGFKIKMTRSQEQIILIILFVVTLLAPFPTFAWSGKCVGIQDGDTITVLKDGKDQVRIRFHGIDCPERGQAFGNRARQFTSEMVFKKIVEIKPTDVDRYGRIVAWVFVDEKCVNEELLKAGLARHYKKYSMEPHLAELEDQARKMKRGLRSDPHHVSPWEWRRK